MPSQLPEEQITYEPEITAGLSWAVREPKVTITVHHTGSLVLMGGWMPLLLLFMVLDLSYPFLSA